MSIASDIIRGHTDTIILASLYYYDSYGYEINKYIMKKTQNSYELKDATLYSAFRRLESGGFINSYWGDEEKGARRRYYSITPEGKAAYDKNLKEWQESKTIIDSLISIELIKEDERHNNEGGII